MARFSIISKDGNKIRYEGKPRYIGTYLKPSYLEFSEIASPTPIDWEVGDYIDYPRTGMRYRLYSIPQASKNARKGSHGRAFTYSNVQLHAATKELGIALFKDLVSADNDIHFSTSPDVATFEDVYGIARRIQACMDDLYPNRWVIEVADFNAVEDAEMLENITTAKDFALSGGTCLDALTKIYELWQEVGWIHTYDSASGRDVITIGYANKRIGANTTEAYIYGKGNGLTAIKKTQANKDEFATRLYVYGSDRNLPSRYYNGKYILNAESVDIRNLMIPIGQWKTTGGVPDARKAYLENAEAVAKYGVIPKTHYFDSDDAGADIYPTIEGITIGQVRRLQADYKPSTSIYPNDEERIDEVKSAVNPNDDGVIRPLGKAYKYYKIENVEAQKSEITLTDSTVVKVNKILLLTDLEGEGKVDMTVIPNIGFTLDDAGFTEVNATFELTDSPTKTKRISKISSVVAKRNGITGRWEFKAPRISVDYDYVSTGSIPVSYVLTLEATLSEKREGEKIAFDIEQGEIEVGANALLDKEFTITLKQIGFNIEERASVGSGKTISMKTGDNEGRNFVIKECRYEGSSDSWILTCKRQQDNNLGMLFPNKDYQIKQNDRFVLLDIAMPELYVAAAMERLFTEGQKLLSKVSRIQNNYEPSIDAKVMAESGRTIREGMFMQIADEDIIDGATEYILIDTINIYEDEAVIPTYKVTLKEKKKVSYKGTPSATTTSNTSSVEEKTDVDLSGYVTKEKFAAIEFLKDLFYKYDDTTYGTKYNLFSEKEMSANGLNFGSGTSGGGGLIQNVLGKSAFGTVASEDNATTFNAYAIDSLYKRIVELEGKDVEVDLSDYYTKQQTQNAITSALSPYIKATDADGKYAALASFNALQSSFDSLYSALNDDTSGVINTWNEVVDFVNEYSGSEDLSTILGKMNTDINARVKVSDFDTWKTDVFNPLSVTVTNLGNKVDTNTANINKLLGWFNVDADGNLFTTYNFYSTKEISANGISQGTGGGGSGLISSVLGVGSLGATLTNDNSVVFNAYATNEIYKATQGHASRIGVLESQVGQLTTQGTKVSVSDLLTTGTQIATITVDGVAHEVKGDFLPTSGGTINTDSGYGLTINRTNAQSTLIAFRNQANLLGFFGFTPSGMPVYLNSSAIQYNILHSGNIGEYALKSNGGTIGNYLAIASNSDNKLILNETGTDTKYQFIEFQNQGVKYGALGTFGDDNLKWSGSILLHSSNYSQYALPTSGGVIAGTLMNPLTIKTSAAIEVGIPMSVKDSVKMWVGWNSSNGAYIYNSAKNYYLGIKDDGTPHYNGNTLIHTGNVGSQTVETSWLLGRKQLQSINDVDSVAWYDWNNQLGDSFAPYVYGILLRSPDANIYTRIAISHNGDSLRLRHFNYSLDSGWKTLAFTYSNVASATKLKTARTIWGQSFDGTGDVSGDLKINASDKIYWNADSQNYFLSSNGTSVLTYNFYGGHKFCTNAGEQRLLINNSGNVTIGSSDLATEANGNPKLYVDGGDNRNVLLLNSNADGGPIIKVMLNGVAKSWWGYNPNIGGAFFFGPSDSGVFVADSGNVGIGTTSPAYKLDVNGNVAFGAATGCDVWLKRTTGYNYINAAHSLAFTVNNDSANIAATFGRDKNASFYGAVTMSSTLTVGGTTSVSALKVGSSAQSNILMQRPSYNYIWAEQAGGTLVFGVQDVGATGTQNASLWIHSNFVMPGTRDNTVALGSELYRWSIVHAFVGRFHGNLSVASTSTFTGKTTHNGGIGATTIETSGAATIGGNLTINGATTHNGIAYFGGTTYYINTSGNANFNAISGSSLQVDSATFNGTIHSNEYSGSVAKWSITKDGAASFASLSNGGLLETSTLRVSSTSTFTGKTNHNGGIGATSLNVSGTSTLSGHVGIKASSHDDYSLYISGPSYMTGDLTVKGTLKTNDIEGGDIYITASSNLFLNTGSGYLGVPSKRWAIDGYGNYKGQSLYINPRDNDNEIIYDDKKKQTHGFPRENVAVFVNGDIAATGEISANALNQGSDIRFKHQLGDITLDLDKIANAPMFRFTWTNKENSRVQIGTSAQYWKDSARELVSVDKDDFHRLDYATLGVLIGVTLGKTVKNHEDRIKELETKVESLEAENRRLRYGN